MVRRSPMSSSRHCPRLAVRSADCGSSLLEPTTEGPLAASRSHAMAKDPWPSMSAPSPLRQPVPPRARLRARPWSPGMPTLAGPFIVIVE